MFLEMSYFCSLADLCNSAEHFMRAEGNSVNHKGLLEGEQALCLNKFFAEQLLVSLEGAPQVKENLAKGEEFNTGRWFGSGGQCFLGINCSSLGYSLVP